MKRKIIKVLEKRQAEFSAEFNKFEKKKMQSCIEAIEEYIPPEYFDEALSLPPATNVRGVRIDETLHSILSRCEQIYTISPQRELYAYSPERMREIISNLKLSTTPSGNEVEVMQKGDIETLRLKISQAMDDANEYARNTKKWDKLYSDYKDEILDKIISEL